MSHFSVLVIGSNIEQQLQPYHEFECTGTDDQYVVEVDKTADARELFAKATEVRMKAPDGTLHSRFTPAGAWDPRFSVPDPKFTGDNNRKEFVPEGYERTVVPASTVTTFAEWTAGWYGLSISRRGSTEVAEPDAFKFGRIDVSEDGEVLAVIDRTNPNKKWDWWAIGGRWSGFLMLKKGTTGKYSGEKGAFGEDKAEDLDRCDQTTKGNVDFGGMRDAAEAKARKMWNDARTISDGRTWEPWSQVLERIGRDQIDAAREFYREQPAVIALEASRDPRFIFDLDENLVKTEDEYAQIARDRALSTYALVKDGQWLAKGDMGWFGISNDTVAQDDWNKKVSEMLDALPDDVLLTVVDCHI